MTETADRVDRARALMAVHRYDDAIAELASAVATDPQNASLWTTLAFAHLRTRQSTRALECARTAIALDPEDPGAHHLESQALLRVRQTRPAIAAARRGLSLAPHDSKIHAQLGIALACSHPGAWRESSRHSRMAISLAPHDPHVYVAAGNASLKMRRRKRAERYFRQALELDPTSSTAMNNLAVARSNRGRELRAAADLGYAAAGDPANPLYRANLDTITHRMLGRVLRALLGVAVATAVAWWLGLLLIVAGLAWFAHVLRSQDPPLSPAARRYLLRRPLEDRFVAVETALVGIVLVSTVIAPLLSVGLLVVPFAALVVDALLHIILRSNRRPIDRPGV